MACNVTETRTCAVDNVVLGTCAGVGEDTIGKGGAAWEQVQRKAVVNLSP